MLPAPVGVRRHARALSFTALVALAAVAAGSSTATAVAADGPTAGPAAKKKQQRCRIVKVALRKNGRLVLRHGKPVKRTVRICGKQRCTLTRKAKRTKSGKLVRRHGRVVYRKAWKCNRAKRKKAGRKPSLVPPNGGGGGSTPSAPGPQRRPARTCSQTVSSTATAQSAVAGAASGAVVCLADGNYGELTLNASKPGEVVVRPVTSGGATIAGASLAGSRLTLEAFLVTDEVTVQPGSSQMTVQFNRITGGYMGVNAGPTTSTQVNDVTIRGNRFVGPFGEDAIRLNRYHDADGDGYGALVEGNEFTNVRENGNHSDCLQTVWVGDHLVYRRNYLHDNRCQGFFVKDQASAVDSIVAEDNLFVRNDAPCAGSSSCGLPAPFQVWGPVGTFRSSHNTIWEGIFTLRNSPWGSASVTDSVLHKLYSDSSAPFANYAASGNLTCVTNSRGTYPLTGTTVNCTPPFVDPAHDDFRLPSGQGVTWRPADQHYGP